MRLTLAFSLLFPLVALADEKKPEPTVPAGFTALFNGKDLKGWKAHGGNLEKWGVDAKAGTFYTARAGGWLMTEKEYGDFELLLDFRVPRGGNSGVALRSPMMGDPAYTGMEIQILDDPSYKGLQKWQHTGSIYGVVASSSQPTKPLGDWNTYKITCKGRQVTVVLNGKKIVDANLDDHKEKHAKAHPGILRARGHVGVQDHGGKVEFRNVFIKELK